MLRALARPVTSVHGFSTSSVQPHIKNAAVSLALILGAFLCPLLDEAQARTPDSETIPVVDPGFAPEETPGILHPFRPVCEYREGEYECTNFAFEFCRQSPTPENCFIMHFMYGGTLFGSVGHALNITRVRLSDGSYLYCAIEPQVNLPIPGSCWISDADGYVPSQRSIIDAICKFYEERDSFKCERRVWQVFPSDGYKPNL